MNKTKDQQAQEYAKRIQKDFIHNRLVTEELAFEDIEAAWLAGYTAAEQSMWRSVEEELPPIGKLILCRDADRVALAYFDGEAITEAVFPNEDVTMPFWMPIPSLPGTNTEKK